MIVNVCGFGWSGSGAYIDLLREYEEVTFPTKSEWEFNFLWVPDGLYDLELKLCHKHCRIFDSALAINRFLAIAKEYGENYSRYDKVLKTSFYQLCEDYIKQLVDFRLEGYTLIHKLHPSNKDRVIRQYNRFISVLNSRHLISKELLYTLHIDNYKQMMVSYNPERFLDITQNFVSSIINRVRKDKNKILVLNQSLPPDMPQLFDHYFSECHKTIVVRRDPRDQYILIKKLKGISRPVPTEIDDFILFYKKTIGETILPDSDTLLSIQYEDLIYNYISTIKKIENFLGLKSHNRKMLFFKPEDSINNTQLVKIYPEFQEDVQRIEVELKPYLFNFEDYKYERNSNIIF
jgi:hypothetical protein